MEINGISVIICCYNSAKRLPHTLNYLAKQEVPPKIPWEIVLVNNNSSDDTELVARNYWERVGGEIPLVIVRETEPGLSNARKKGVLASRYKYLLFCDDDNWLDSQYLRNLFHVFETDSTGRLALIGGKGRPVLEDGTSMPVELFPFYACGDQLARVSRPSHRHLYGAGLAVKKNALLQLYKIGYDFVLEDRKGNSLTSGGDTEMCLILGYLGYELKYESQMTFDHFMPSSRMRESYLERLKRGSLNSFIRLLPTVYIIDGKRVDLNTWVKDIFYQAKSLLLILFSEKANKVAINLKYSTLCSVIKNRKEYLYREGKLIQLKSSFNITNDQGKCNHTSL